MSHVSEEAPAISFCAFASHPDSSSRTWDTNCLASATDASAMSLLVDCSISGRMSSVADRAVPGHWEGDLIIGTGRSAIGTLVERSSRSAVLVHLPRLEGWGEKPPVKNGPSLGGYGAVAMNAALTTSIMRLPAQLRKTLTWDRGKELSGHAQFTLDTGTSVLRRPALALAAANE